MHLISKLLVLVLLLSVFLVPLYLTIKNMIYLARAKKENRKFETAHVFITFALGFPLTILLFLFLDTRYEDWHVILKNSELHTPLATFTAPTLLIFLILAFLGLLILLMKDCHRQLPPLLLVLCISSIYIGWGLSIAFILQVIQPDYTAMLALLPFNYILISLKLVIREIHAFPYSEDNRYTGLRKLLYQSKHWPLLALLCLVPLLCIVIAFLTLFGQAPSSIIQAFTQTSDWNLSTQISPPNVHFDEHYLCTVAANGHKKLVKPLRLGKRHGHIVTVNRQLCIANAFEQILEEQVPRLHKKVRHFYDSYGYPIARHIHSPYLADFIYLLMKPAEWTFLTVIYLCDREPENRIALQYMGDAPAGNERKYMIY